MAAQIIPEVAAILGEESRRINQPEFIDADPVQFPGNFRRFPTSK